MTPRETIGRREFMTLSAAATATVLTLENVGGNLAIAGTPAVANGIDLKAATSATFRALVGQSFHVSGTSRMFVLDQVEVFTDRNQAMRPRGIRKESFSLWFSAPAGAPLPDGIHTFTSPTRGSFEVFMIEASTLSTPAKVYYQVPFG